MRVGGNYIKRFNNIIGKTFTYWTVISQENNICYCICKCGTKKAIKYGVLVSGKTKSCRPCTFIRRYDDIYGKVFGDYLVTSNAYKKDYNNGKYIFVKCKCMVCGKEGFEIPVSRLISGESTMCQKCAAINNFKKATEVQRNRRLNQITYVFDGDICKINISNNIVLIDKDDYKFVKDYVWRVMGGYVYTGHKKESNLISMHRLVMEKNGFTIEDNKQIDHVNRNKTDNRKSNLKIVTASENLQNRGRFRNNTSGTKGVTYVGGYWRATIGYDNKKHTVGNYKTKDEAINARVNAENNVFEYVNTLKKEGVYIE